MKYKYFLLASFFGMINCIMVSFSAKAQDTVAVSTSPFKITADLVSSYVWRGVLSSPTPNFQPTFAFTKGGVELGVWGSTDFVGLYKEVDLYASYTTGPLKFTVTDYDWNFKTEYFNYTNKVTDHILEGSVAFTGPESFPLSICTNVMLLGADKKFDFSNGTIYPIRQNYSTYIELCYAFKYFSPFLGITPANGYYGDSYGKVKGFGIVNLGVTATKSLKITDSFSLPLKATLGFNPQKSDVYLVFGITF